VRFADWGFRVVACFVKVTGSASDWSRQIISQQLYTPVYGDFAPVFLGPQYDEDADRLRFKQLKKNRIPWFPTITCN
jgi:hypothetical protein